MTADDHTPETNQDVFDDYVRYMLKSAGVNYIDQPVEQIIQTIEHGEAGQETALNLMAIAYVTMMFAYCPTPFSSMKEDELILASENEQAPQPWFIQLLNRVPRIGSVLSKCEDLLKGLPDHDGRSESEAVARIICEVLPSFFSNPPMKKLQAKRLFSTDAVIIDSMLVVASNKDKNLSREKTEDAAAVSDALTTGIGQLFSRLALTIEPDLRHFPSWHLYYFGHSLSARFDARSELAYSEWCSIVDFVADLMRQGAVWDNTELDHEWGLEDKYPVWSAEHWAWQFGRVASLFFLAEKDFDKQEDFGLIEALTGWDNGLTVFAIIQEHVPYPDFVEKFNLWSGVYVSLYNEIGGDQRLVNSEDALAPYNQTPKSRLYWIMRLGYLAGMENLRKEPSTTYVWKNTGDGSESLEIEEITQPTIPALASKPEIAPLQGTHAVHPVVDIERVTETILEWHDSADYRKEQEISARLATHLGEITTTIAGDAMDALVAAEFAYSLSPIRRPRHFSLDYAKAVECALEDYLKRPRRQRNWPGSDIGKWYRALTEDELRSESKFEKGQRRRLRAVIGKNFDMYYASDLAERLNVLRQLRVRDAHQDNRPPRPQVVREVVLGDGNSPSIFELILRFARNWPPKE